MTYTSYMIKSNTFNASIIHEIRDPLMNIPVFQCSFHILRVNTQ